MSIPIQTKPRNIILFSVKDNGKGFQGKQTVSWNGKRTSSLLLKSMHWIGLIEESNCHVIYQVSSFVFKFLLIFVNLSTLVSSIIAFEFENWKIVGAFVCSYFFALAVYISMYRKKKLLTCTLHDINRTYMLNNGTSLNFITFVLCCLPIVYSILKGISYDNITLKYEAYGHPVQEPIAQILLIRSKAFLEALVHPTFPCLVALLYCTLCHHCCSLINFLTQHVQQIPPKNFRPSKQMNILKHKAKIDEILSNIQDIFSVPTFFIIITNLLTCGVVIGWLLNLDFSNIRLSDTIESAFHGVIEFSSLITVPWVASEMSIHLEKLKAAFYDKLRLRLLYTGNLEEPQPKKETLGKLDFTFTGCDIISFKRSTILALCGTLLTYTILVVNQKD
ncbi:uncharacterized protein TNCT_410941 [Trichonephila clavata]|uniref:Gustatory receptor n=1 Tax=Trichonephila clavata TaxID=2740835 RepID=A0A8X6LBC1_TRICU|nr:uncharacterized protein TNCT_410941 [Trichonephila clavata]